MKKAKLSEELKKQRTKKKNERKISLKMDKRGKIREMKNIKRNDGKNTF